MSRPRAPGFFSFCLSWRLWLWRARPLGDGFWLVGLLGPWMRWWRRPGGLRPKTLPNASLIYPATTNWDDWRLCLTICWRDWSARLAPCANSVATPPMNYELP